MTQTQRQTEPSTRSSWADVEPLDYRKFTPEGWILFAEMLAPALEMQCEQTAETLCQLIADGLAQPWGVKDDEGGLIGAAVTTVNVFPSGLRTLTLLLGATTDTNLTWAAMRSAVATLEEFGREQDCDVVRIYGRRGWIRLLRDYDVDYVCLQKTIGGEVQ